ncbi:MAG: DUF1015 domain-containing protein [Bernardetiaceae bacterium]|nr:DUF1015 domain-containing protein [Bernardetiaceae bacterium]
MAEIKPLRAWRYNPEKFPNIDTLISPLFDVISEKQREALYQNPYNSIHLSVPRGANPSQEAAQILKKWQQEGALLQDEKPAIYVYYQHFHLPNSQKSYCRKGFIAFIKAYDWDKKVLLRHENTIPAAVNDRIELLAETKLNASPTHGLYYDPTFHLQPLMDSAMQNPIYETENYQGVRDVMAKIDEPEQVQIFIDHIQNQSIILADGHHRYEGSLTYRKAQKAANPNHTGKEGYNYHLMYLTNAASNDLRVLPTHRLLKGFENFSEEGIINKLSAFFTVKNVEMAQDLNEIILGKTHCFGLAFAENSYKIRLKPEALDKISWNFPRVVKQLDLTVLHYFLIEKVLGIERNAQRSSPHIVFERNFTDCLRKVSSGEAQCAAITNAVTMEEIQAVCHSGYTMPQKSTYFYPKAICGFLFGSIVDDVLL